MPTPHDLLLFILAALLLVLTPGPNMIYLMSRSVIQGRRAGLLSLAGVVTGFLGHMLAASFGLTALLLAVPYAYLALKLAGSSYLLWLAWNAVRPGGTSPLTTRDLPHDAPARLFRMGLLTSALNPKVAVFYLALLPQFVHPGQGSPLAQSLVLGFTQITMSFTINLLIVLSASRLAAFLATRPSWLKVQRYLMGAVLGGRAVRIALDKGR